MYRVKENILRPRRKNLIWDRRYFCGGYDDQWYASLFEPGEGKVTGEITPVYGTLKPEKIEHISKIMPKVKIIYIMRNPVDRMWSNIKHILRHQRRRINSYPLDEFIGLIEDKYNKLQGEYLKVIDNWQVYFPKEQIFIGFFEEIVNAPEEILLRLYRFLGGGSRQEVFTERC